jgi:uncharacterized membrane protein
MPLKLIPSLRIGIQAVVAALLAGAILHIATTFTLARIGATAPVYRISANLLRNQMQILPPVTPRSQVLPYQPPDSLTAACPFDTSGGPVIVRAVLPGAGWSLSVHTETADNVYAVLGIDGRRTEIGVMLVPAGDGFIPLPRDAVGTQAMQQVAVPGKTGVVLITAPLASEAWRQAAESDLKRAACIQAKP